MNRNEKKIKNSEEQRLKSLEERANEYKDKQRQIKSVQNKKIVFNDSDDDGNQDIETSRPTESYRKQNLIEPKNKKSKKTLFDDEDEDDDDDGDEENGFMSIKLDKSIENKINLDEDKANQLIQLKTKFSNDSRFKIDERFVESEDDDDAGEDKSDGGENNDDDDGVNRAEMNKEKENALKILSSLTGKTILPQSKRENDSNKVKKMVRYDPTIEDHKMYEVHEEQQRKVNKKSEKIEKLEEQEDKVNESLIDETRFYEIQPDIKSLLCSNEVFKFKFSNDDDKLSEDEERNDKNGKVSDRNRKTIDYINNKFDKVNNSFESSSDEDDDRDRRQERNESKDNSIDQRRIDVHEKEDFMPSINSKHVEEALKFFIREKDVNDLRQEWSKLRKDLVEEYKKKHQKAKRIKRIKDEEKQFQWKKKPHSSFENKKIIK